MSVLVQGKQMRKSWSLSHTGRGGERKGDDGTNPRAGPSRIIGIVRRHISQFVGKDETWRLHTRHQKGRSERAIEKPLEVTYKA